MGRIVQRIARSLDIVVWLGTLIFGLGVVILGPGAAIALKIVPSVCLGAAVLGMWHWLYRRLYPDRAPPERFSWRPVLIILAVGIAARLLFSLAVHPVPESDFDAYWQSATHLVDKHEFVVYEPASEPAGPVYELRAYRPPGPAFLVALAMLVVGKNIGAVLLINLLCFAGTLLCVTDGCRRFLPSRSACWAAALVAFWPSDIAMSGLPQSEAPSILGTALLLWLTATLGRRLHLWAVSAGAVTGLSCLVRNSNLIVIGVFALYALRSTWSWTRRVLMIATITLCTIAILVPWGIRNYRLLHAWVLVATNGGPNFFTANNPRGDGSWTLNSHNESHRLMPDEVRMDREDFALATDWVAHNPVRYLKLTIPKFRLLVQTDDHGPYWALERGRHYTGFWYRSAALVADAWWIFLWLLTLETLFCFPRWKNQSTMLFAMALGIVPESLFLVFLSAGRYHASMTPAIVCLAAWAVCRPRDEKAADRQSAASRHSITSVV